MNIPTRTKGGVSMNDAIQFVVPGIPVAQPRPRATMAHGGKHARMHEVTSIKNSDGTRKPHPIAAFKATVRLAAEKAYQGAPLLGPLRVDVLCILPRPTNKIWKTKPMPRIWHEKKPDRDNVDKAVLDALTGQLWKDDCQACIGLITKLIAAGDEQPHVVVTVTPLKPYEEEDEACP